MVHSENEFYNEMWNQWRDDLLIRHLDFYSCYDKTKCNAESKKIFDTILAFQHSWGYYGITSDDIAVRFQSLEKRYETWRSIIEREDVMYNKESNKVTATENISSAIYKEYELGGLYSNDESEHLWDELCGIFGPDSVRIARNAMITPIPKSKLTWKREGNNDHASDSEDEWITLPFDEVDHDETPDPKVRVPKGHICPYPGDALMKKPAIKKGASSSAGTTDGQKKKGKSKRFLDF